MDARLTIASHRTTRAYLPTPLAAGACELILDAGRLAGSAKNNQPWRFVVVHGSAREAVAATVYVPGHVRSAALVVALVVTPFGGVSDVDAGRAAQNMMLAAWSEGIGSCPNGVADHRALACLLGLAKGQRVPLVITFGVPDPPRDPARRSPERWSAGARRIPLHDLVTHLGEDL